MEGGGGGRGGGGAGVCRRLALDGVTDEHPATRLIFPSLPRSCPRRDQTAVGTLAVRAQRRGPRTRRARRRRTTGVPRAICSDHPGACYHHLVTHQRARHAIAARLLPLAISASRRAEASTVPRRATRCAAGRICSPSSASRACTASAILERAGVAQHRSDARLCLIAVRAHAAAGPERALAGLMVHLRRTHVTLPA